MEPMTGGCQCGAVRYTITGTPRRLTACHCTDCQRQSGSAFGMSLVVAAEDFRLTEGELARHETVSAAGRRKAGCFCPACGTRIYHQAEWRRGDLTVKPGTLDDTSGLVPDMHIWTASKQPWVVIPEDVESHPGQPPRP